MEAFGDEFLTGAAFADDKDRAIKFGRAPGLLDCIEEG